MPRFVKFLAKPFKKKPEKDLSYYYGGYLISSDSSAVYPAPGDKNDDDVSSTISVLTMETIDDNPGPGRTIDTYFCQPVGRKIERFAMRIKISSLPPWRIFQYLDNGIEM